jgi:hypothetical protein
MSITSIIEDWRSRSGDDTPGGRAYKRYFQVRFDGTDSSDAVETLALYTQLALPDRIPARFESHPADPSVVVGNKRVERVGPQDCLVTCEYKSPAAISREYPQPVSDNPLNDPPEVSWKTVLVSRPIEIDLNNKIICNSADEPIDCQEDVADVVLVYSRNVSSFNSARALDYCNAINSDFFLSYQPGTAKVIRYDGEKRYVASSENPGVYTAYYRETIEIQFHDVEAYGWLRVFPDEGYREKTASTPTYETIVDANDVPVSKPVFLDGAGRILANPNINTIYKHTFITNRVRNFSVLNISV